MGQGHEAGVLVGDDKGRGVGAGAAEEVLVVGADGDGDHERAQDVEEAEADPDGADGLGHGAARVRRLGGDEAARLGAGHGEDARRHDVEEALEAVGEAAGLVPVAEADGPALGGAAGRDDDERDDDDEDPAELDGGEDDLGLGEVVDGADVDEDDDDEEDGDPAGRGDLLAALPEAEDGDEAGELVGDGDPVLEPVAPAEREAGGRVDELVGPLHEGRGEGIQDGHLTDGLGDRPDHGPGEDVLRRRGLSVFWLYIDIYIYIFSHVRHTSYLHPMNRAAGPPLARLVPLPSHRPIPIEEPRAIMETCLLLSRLWSSLSAPWSTTSPTPVSFCGGGGVEGETDFSLGYSVLEPMLG